jgi:hypothetical protein
MANYNVTSNLDFTESTIPATDRLVHRRNFRDSVYYSDPVAVTAPKVVINFEGAHINIRMGDAVRLQCGSMGVLVSIGCEDADNPMQHTVKVMPITLASKLSRSDQRHARHLLEQSAFSGLLLNRILVAIPADSDALQWDSSLYETYSVSEISHRVDFVWEYEDLSQNVFVLFLQRSSIDKSVEIINPLPFLHNYAQYYESSGSSDHSPVIMISLYVDGFRTWVSRSGNVTAVYMSLPQLSLDHLNKTTNVHLIALIPSGVDEDDVLRVVSEDINDMVLNGLQNVWIATGPNRDDGYSQKLRVLLAFIKGDTPQRASYTSTVGASGNRSCHACEADKENITDPNIVHFKRRTYVQFDRLRSEYLQSSNSKSSQTELRKRTGYSISEKSVCLR